MAVASLDETDSIQLSASVDSVAVLDAAVQLRNRKPVKRDIVDWARLLQEGNTARGNADLPIAKLKCLTKGQQT